MIYTGVFTSNLSRADEFKNSLTLFLEKRDESTESIARIAQKEAVLHDVILGRNLLDNTGDDQSFMVFCALYTAVKDIHVERMELEQAGHPEYVLADSYTLDYVLGDRAPNYKAIGQGKAPIWTENAMVVAEV